MYSGSRVTDAVLHLQTKGEHRGAVRLVRQRPPERFRWRSAVAGVNKVAGTLRGLERMRIEEPIRELVLGLRDRELRTEVILDARRAGVDLDRGEVLPLCTLSELERLARCTGASLERVRKYTALPIDPRAPIDTAACAVVGRTLAEHYRVRAHRLWLSIPDPDGPEALMQHHRFMLDRASRDRAEAERWAQFAQALLGRSEA